MPFRGPYEFDEFDDILADGPDVCHHGVGFDEECEECEEEEDAISERP